MLLDPVGHIVTPVRAQIVYDVETSSYGFCGDAMPTLKKRKEERLAQPPPRMNGSGVMAVPLMDPIARAREWAAAVGQLIGAAKDLTGVEVGFRVTPLLSGVTVSWERRSLPSRQWLRDLEQEIITYGICNGLQIWFREY